MAILGPHPGARTPWRTGKKTSATTRVDRECGQPGRVAHASLNPSTREADSSQILWVLGQPGIPSETGLKVNIRPNHQNKMGYQKKERVARACEEGSERR